MNDPKRKPVTVEELRARMAGNVKQVDTMFGTFKVRKLPFRELAKILRPKLAEAAAGGAPGVAALDVDDAEANRAILLACVIEPELSDDLLVEMEADGIPYADLLGQVKEHNGLIEDVQRAAGATFCAGPGGPGE